MGAITWEVAYDGSNGLVEYLAFDDEESAMDFAESKEVARLNEKEDTAVLNSWYWNGNAWID